MPTYKKVRIDGVRGSFNIDAADEKELEAKVGEFRAKYAGKSPGQIAQSIWAEQGLEAGGRKSAFPEPPVGEEWQGPKGGFLSSIGDAIVAERGLDEGPLTVGRLGPLDNRAERPPDAATGPLRPAKFTGAPYIAVTNGAPYSPVPRKPAVPMYLPTADQMAPLKPRPDPFLRDMSRTAEVRVFAPPRYGPEPTDMERFAKQRGIDAAAGNPFTPVNPEDNREVTLGGVIEKLGNLDEAAMGRIRQNIQESGGSVPSGLLKSAMDLIPVKPVSDYILNRGLYTGPSGRERIELALENPERLKALDEAAKATPQFTDKMVMPVTGPGGQRQLREVTTTGDTDPEGRILNPMQVAQKVPDVPILEKVGVPAWAPRAAVRGAARGAQDLVTLDNALLMLGLPLTGSLVSKLAHTGFTLQGTQMAANALGQLKDMVTKGATEDDIVNFIGNGIGAYVMLKEPVKRGIATGKAIKDFAGGELAEAAGQGFNESGRVARPGRSAVAPEGGIFPEGAVSAYQNPLEGVVGINNVTGERTVRRRGSEIPLPNERERAKLEADVASVREIYPNANVEQLDEWTYRVRTADGQEFTLGGTGNVKINPQAEWAANPALVARIVERETNGKVKVDPKAKWEDVADAVTTVFSRHTGAGVFRPGERLPTGERGPASVTVQARELGPGEFGSTEGTAPHEVGHFAEDVEHIPTKELTPWYSRFAAGVAKGASRSDYLARFVEALKQARTNMGKGLLDFPEKFFTGKKGQKKTLGEMFPEMFGEQGPAREYGWLPAEAALLPHRLLSGKYAPKGEATPYVSGPKSPEQLQREAAELAKRAGEMPKPLTQGDVIGVQARAAERAPSEEVKAELAKKAPVQGPVMAEPWRHQGQQPVQGPWQPIPGQERFYGQPPVEARPGRAYPEPLNRPAPPPPPAPPLESMIEEGAAREESAQAQAARITERRQAEGEVEEMLVDRLLADEGALGRAALDGSLNRLSEAGRKRLREGLRGREEERQFVERELAKGREVQGPWPEPQGPPVMRPGAEVEGPWPQVQGPWPQAPTAPTHIEYARGQWGEVVGTPDAKGNVEVRDAKGKSRIVRLDQEFPAQAGDDVTVTIDGKPVRGKATSGNRTQVGVSIEGAKPKLYDRKLVRRVPPARPEGAPAPKPAKAAKATPQLPLAPTEAPVAPKAEEIQPASVLPLNPRPAGSERTPRPALLGREGRITRLDQKKVRFRWAVMEAADLLPSHRLDGVANEGYDPALQGRLREQKESEIQLTPISNNPDIEQLVAAPSAREGAPVVLDNGMAFTNGRVAALQAAYAKGTANAYREGVAAVAGDYGIDDAAVRKMQNPVLVRIVTDEATLASREAMKDFAEDTNKKPGLELTPFEMARQDAGRFALEDLGGLDTAFPVGAPANRNWLLKFMRRFVGKEEMRKYAANGVLTPDAKDRADRALLVVAYGEGAQRLVDWVPEDTKNIQTALRRVAPAFAKVAILERAGKLEPMDIQTRIIEAADLLHQIAQDGSTLEKFLRQREGAMIADNLSPATIHIAKILDAEKRYAPQLAEVLDAVAEARLLMTRESRSLVEGHERGLQEVSSIEKLFDEGVSSAREARELRASEKAAKATERQEAQQERAAAEADAARGAEREEVVPRPPSPEAPRESPEGGRDEGPGDGGEPPDNVTGELFSSSPIRPEVFRPIEPRGVDPDRNREMAREDLGMVGLEFGRRHPDTNPNGEVVVRDRFGGTTIRVLGVYDGEHLVSAAAIAPNGHINWLWAREKIWTPKENMFWGDGKDELGKHLALRDPSSPYMRVQSLLSRNGVTRRPDDRMSDLGARAHNERLLPVRQVIDILNGYRQDPELLARATDLGYGTVTRGLEQLADGNYYSKEAFALLEGAYEIARTKYARERKLPYQTRASDEAVRSWREAPRGDEAGPRGTSAYRVGGRRDLGGQPGDRRGAPAGPEVSPFPEAKTALAPTPQGEVYSSLPVRAAEPTPVYYSKLRREVEAGQGRWKPADLLRFLKARGVKPEEMEWSRLDNLVAGKDSVTKQEILEHLDENAVEVREKVKEGRGRDEAVRLQAVAERAYERELTARDAFLSAKAEVREDDPASIETFRAASREMANAHVARNTADNAYEAARAKLEEPDTKYSGYTLPGGENYRELLLTMPPETRPTARRRFARMEEIKAEIERRTAADPENQKLEREIEDINRQILDPGFYELPSEKRREIRDQRDDLELRLRQHHDYINRDLYAERNRLDGENFADRQFASPHFSEPNILAHVRFNERTGPNGERILHIEEVQSDWHQQGRERGYTSNKPAEIVKEEIGNDTTEFRIKGMGPGRNLEGYVAERNGQFQASFQNKIDRFPTALQAERWVRQQMEPVAVKLANTEGVPDAPFKKTWPDLALKRVIRWAADEGFDKVTWTTGEQQAERYDLSKQVGRIYLVDPVFAEDGKLLRGRIEASPLSGGPALNADVTGDSLPHFIGKEAARRIVEEPSRQEGRTLVLEDEGLKVGGSGMNVFYDAMLPAKMQEIARKLDPSLKVGETELDLGTRGGEPRYHYTPEGVRQPNPDYERREVVHSLDLTPLAREAAQKGFPLFSSEPIRSVRDMVRDARKHEDWKDWYVTHKATIDGLFEEDAPLFRRLLAATSQAASVGSNVSLAVKAYEQLKRGEPFTGFLPAVIKNLERIRAEEKLEGPKIGAYEQATGHKAGAAQGAPVDRHIAQYVFGVNVPNQGQIATARDMMQQAADRLGWDPRQVQAAIWAFKSMERQEARGHRPEVKSYADYLESRADAIREFRASFRAENPPGERGGVPVGGEARAGTEPLASLRPITKTYGKLAEERPWLKNVEARRGQPGPEPEPDYVRANIGETPQQREMLSAYAKERITQGLPALRKDEEVIQEVRERLRKDRDGEEKRLLELTARGARRFEDADNLMMGRFVKDYLDRFYKDGDQEALQRALVMENARAEQLTEAARALRIGRDMFESPAERARAWFDRALLQPVNERVAKGMREGNPDALKEQAEHIEKLRKKLAKEGADPSNWTDEQLMDPYFVSEKIREVFADKASLGDKAYEWWSNAILSGPMTHMVNTASNVLSLLWEYGLQRPTEAAVAGVLRGDTTEWNSLLAAYKALASQVAWSEGMRNARQAWETEATVLEQKTKGEMFASGASLDFPRVAIAGEFGRKVRYPYRFLKAADEFAKGVVGQMEAAASAYKIGTAEGLKGDALGKRMLELTSDYTSKAWSDAVSKAELLAFQKKLGTVGQAVLKLRKVRGLRYFLPFVTTPFNIFHQGVEKTPLGVVTAVGKWRAAVKADGSVREAIRKGTPEGQAIQRAIAEQIIGFTVGAVMVGVLNNQDPDDGLVITGPVSFRQDPRGEREARYRSLPPSSFIWKTSDGSIRSVSYARLEPFATMLGLMSDAVGMARHANSTSASEKFVEAFDRLTGQLRDKTFLKGIGDIIAAAEDTDKAERWLTNFGSSWMPNIVKQPLRAADPMLRETRAWGAKTPTDVGETKTMREARRFAYSTLPIEPFAPPPRRDILGKPITKLGGDGPAAFLMRQALPTQLGDLDRQTPKGMIEFDHKMFQLREEKGTKASYFPRLPDPSYEVTRPDGTKRKVYMTDDQYAKFLGLAGRYVAETLKTAPYFKKRGRLTADDAETYKRDVQTARERAKREMFKR